MKLSPDVFLKRLLVSLLLLAPSGWSLAAETLTIKVTAEEFAALKAHRARVSKAREEKKARERPQAATAAPEAPAPLDPSNPPYVTGQTFSTGHRLKFTERLVEENQFSASSAEGALSPAISGPPVITIERTSIPPRATNSFAPVDSLARSLDGLEAASAPEPAAQGGFLEAFRLRQSGDPAKLYLFDKEKGTWKENEANALSSDGAEFTWTRNNVAGSDTWTAQGIALFPIVINPLSGPVRHVILIPSVEFNRDTATDDTPNEINSLIGRIGLDFNFVNNSGLANTAKGYVVHSAIGYQTDFDFASGQVLTEWGIEGINEIQGWGVYSPREGSVDNEKQAALAAVHEKQFLGIKGMPRKIVFEPIFSLASIQDFAEKRSLQQLKDMEYGTVGFKTSLDYELEFLKNYGPFTNFSSTKIGVEYRMWWVVGGSGSQSFDYFDAHITIPFFGTEDRLNLKAFYRVGELPNTLEHVDMLGVALTAKF